MASGLFAIGASGLAAAYTALQTTGHNIANVNTPGYKRQQAVQSALTPQFSGSGFIGKGVDVTSISRAYDELATREVNRAESRTGEANTQATYLARLGTLMGDTTNGVGAAVDGFFNSMQALSMDPSSTGQRAAFLDQARNLAARFTETSGEINELKDGASRELSLSIQSVNELGRQVAALNGRIAQAVATGQTPNDLMDQRDSMVRGIAAEIGVTATTQQDGTMTLLVANGQPLVIGDRSNSLAVGADPTDPAKVALLLQTPNGRVQMGSEGSVMGGKVAALMNLHNRDLAGAEAELGRLAAAIAVPVNDQHQRGLDLKGALGGPLFTLPAPKVDAAGSNTGNAAVGIAISDAAQLKASDYRLAFDGTNYQVTRLADGTKQTFATMPATVDGVAISIGSGAMAAGDSFSLKPVSTRAGGMGVAIADPLRVALALPVAANAAAGNAGSVTVGGLGLAASASANLTQPVTLTFTGSGAFNVSGTGTGNPAGVPYAEGATISYNGWTLKLTGTPKAGDTITIGPNTNLGGDNRNALGLAAFGAGKIVDGQTPAQSFAATLATLGGQSRAANLDAAVQGSIRDDAVAAEQSVSGVNLDEEAANLMQYQQAYQAAAKVIAAAQTVFDALLQLGR